jgi:GNAT superfamily N-acetyltransferase
MFTEVDLILELIRDLAEYERDLKSVEATRERLLSSIAFAPAEGSTTSTSDATDVASLTEPTTPTRPARCYLVFTPEGEAVGMALYFYNYSTWRAKPGIYLEDLFVRPSQRGKGYGKKLLVTLAKEVVKIGGARLEWSVLKWNEPSIKFYESLGAVSQSKWDHYRADGEALEKLAGL